MHVVSRDSEITLHFSLSLPGGEIIDSTVNGRPGTFNFGDGTLPAGFETLLLGLKAGDRRSFLVESEKAFGFHRQENIQRFKAEKLAAYSDEPLVNGLTILFKDASGQHISGVIRDLPEGELEPQTLINVDFNHPLAGRDLHFSVEILDVKPVAQAVQIQ